MELSFWSRRFDFIWKMSREALFRMVRFFNGVFVSLSIREHSRRLFRFALFEGFRGCLSDSIGSFVLNFMLLSYGLKCMIVSILHIYCQIVVITFRSWCFAFRRENIVF